MRTSERTSDFVDQPDLYSTFVKAGDEIAALYEQREFGRAVREIMALADRANQWIDEKQPWVLHDPALRNYPRFP